MSVLIGLDIGTTNTKAVAFALDGRVLARAARPTPVRDLGDRRAVYDPEKLWNAVLGILADLSEQLAPARAIGICAASIGEAGITIDAGGEPTFPAIAWFDERTLPQAAWWNENMSSTLLFQHTGLASSHIYSLNKLMWLRKHEPESFGQTTRWLCISDYVAYRLCNEQATGYSLASRTMAFDPLHARWSDEMLDAAGISPLLWPQPLQEGSSLGCVRPEIGAAIPLLQETPVFVGGHDHVVASLAVGATEPGIMIDSTGTTETQMVALESIDQALNGGNTSFCLGRHVVKDRFYAIAGILGAGSMIQWMSKLLYDTESSREDSISRLTADARLSPVGSKGLWILPHMAGRGAPNRDEASRAVIAGLGLEHSPKDLARATIEGLSFELASLWQALEEFTNQQALRTISVGGGSQNTLWMQIKADITNRQLHVAAEPEAVAKGAAMLAGLGRGLWVDADAATRAWPCATLTVDPQPENAREYARLRTTLESIRPMAHALAQGLKLYHQQAD